MSEPRASVLVLLSLVACIVCVGADVAYGALAPGRAAKSTATNTSIEEEAGWN